MNVRKLRQCLECAIRILLTQENHQKPHLTAKALVTRRIGFSIEILLQNDFEINNIILLVRLQHFLQNHLFDFKLFLNQ